MDRISIETLPLATLALFQSTPMFYHPWLSFYCIKAKQAPFLPPQAPRLCPFTVILPQGIFWLMYGSFCVWFRWLFFMFIYCLLSKVPIFLCKQFFYSNFLLLWYIQIYFYDIICVGVVPCHVLYEYESKLHPLATICTLWLIVVYSKPPHQGWPQVTTGSI